MSTTCSMANNAYEEKQCPATTEGLGRVPAQITRCAVGQAGEGDVVPIASGVHTRRPHITWDGTARM